MLTYSSDSLTQIVCPMDEDAVTPIPFCSAPPHSEPPPPLLPLSSVTSSCVNDGISGHRRSGRIQGIGAQPPKIHSNTHSSRAAHRPPRWNPSPSKRQGESGSTVQVSQSKQLRIEVTRVHDKQNEDGFDFSCTAECQNKQSDQECPQENPYVSATENVVEQFPDNTTQNPNATKSDMDTSGGLAVGCPAENESDPKGWMIGPFFKSFRSKVACFTEIVMSPVKLFKGNSPSPSMDYADKLSEIEANGTCDVEHSDPSNVFHSKEQSEDSHQQRLSNEESAPNTETVGVKYSKELFDVELSTHISESVPLRHSPSPCIGFEKISESVASDIRSSVSLSASHETKSTISKTMEEQNSKQCTQLKPLPRKRTGNRSEFKKFSSKTLKPEVKQEESDPEVSDEQIKSNKADSSDTDKTLLSSVCYTQLDADSLQPDDDDDDGKKIESCSVVQSLQSTLNNSANERTLMLTTDTQQFEYSAGFGGAKKGLELQSHSQDLEKRTKLRGDIGTENAENQELNVASDSGLLRERSSARRNVVLTKTVVDREETLEPARKRQVVSTRANGKGKCRHEMLPVINEAGSKTRTECFPAVVLDHILDKSSGVSENGQKVCSTSKTKPSGSCKQVKMTATGLGKSDASNSMELETTVEVISVQQTEQEPLPEALNVKQLHNTDKCRNINKKPLKRKAPFQAGLLIESDSTLVSTSSVVSLELLKHKPIDFNTTLPVQRKENSKTGFSQTSKRRNKSFRSGVKSFESGGAQETKQCISNLCVITEESQSTRPVDPVCFERNREPVVSPSQPHLNCSVLLNIEVKHFMDKKEKDTASLSHKVFTSDNETSKHSSISVSRLRSGARKVQPRLTDKQRRRSLGLQNKRHKVEEATSSVTMEDAHVTTASASSSENGFARRLLRSYSCPEIPAFHPYDTAWTASPHSTHHSWTRTSQQHQAPHTPYLPNANRSLQRARRHTVCIVEVEREIAPLCLRKEVYPSRRAAPYGSVAKQPSPNFAFSLSTSLSALASSFLSSPLAFLSKKADSRSSAANPSTNNHVSSPTSASSPTSLLSSSTCHLPGFLQRIDSPQATLDSSSSGNPLACETERRPQSEEEDDCECTSSSSQEYEDIGLREEKALSDSEIKAAQKHEERGKVSSIRIRKTLPKPQNNLTPMGLPRPIRLKKKEFSLEEIYTNKNFSKPPESRLETIFEVPLNRRNGSESWFGQKRIKRFLEFLEAGEARKPKKPLVGAGKTVISSSRTRRGSFTKDEPSLTMQDVDSVLCAKLDELNLWLTRESERQLTDAS